LSTALLQTYNSRVQAVARGEGALLVDVYSALVTDLNAYIGIDGLHPTEAGYRRMAALFADAIRGEFELRE
jgi:lysophospholipase L1-like esterase